jgi:hypothetical protein
LKSSKQLAQRQSKSVPSKKSRVSGLNGTVLHWQLTTSPTLHSKLILHLWQNLVSCLEIVAIFESVFCFSFEKSQNTETTVLLRKEKHEDMRPGSFRECLTKTADMYLALFQRNITVARQPGNCTWFHISASKRAVPLLCYGGAKIAKLSS